MEQQKRIKLLAKAWCRWNVSNIDEPENTDELERTWLRHLSKLVVESGEWEKWCRGQRGKKPTRSGG